MLLKELEHTLKRGAKIRILTGNYLGITQPSALYLIKENLVTELILDFIVKKDVLFIPSLTFFIIQITVNFTSALPIFPEVR